VVKSRTLDIAWDRSGHGADVLMSGVEHKSSLAMPMLNCTFLWPDANNT